MKKLGIALIGLSVGLSACDNSIDALETAKKALISEHKAAIRTFKKDSITLDSLILAHPEYAGVKDDVKKVPVTTGKTQVGTFEHFFEVHGNVEVEENATLFAEAPGIVKIIHVREGQSVKKGDLIITLNAAALESGLTEITTALALANKVYEKQSALWEQKIGSEMQYLQAKSNKESLDQKYATLQKQIEMYRIRAPFNGVVDQLIPKVGEAANPGFPLARVLNLNKIYLEGDVSESYMSTIKKGGFVEVKFPSLGETVIAKVARVGNYINPANRTFKVRVEFSNPGGKYKPNQLAVMKLRDYQSVQALIIPERIIQQDRKGNEYIYTYVQEGKVKRVKKLSIQKGLSYEGKTEVISGLDSTVIYIDKGAKTVQEKDAIDIKN